MNYVMLYADMLTITYKYKLFHPSKSTHTYTFKTHPCVAKDLLRVVILDCLLLGCVFDEEINLVGLLLK